ncbi:hypothetical protein CcaverHIS002_0203830 [Cutaneotrichosporon cavernicola]|uniref:Uncharacterized protein n=1 Tax=Cutaneotrichosporon cavernicola TaxID=279322 RepID=A0AA48L2I8_9TREE|nr:uncharacterized protein CcaverHIS019_0203800 [Cutaneotrichosporon cavernicola]BEI81223.1 hypothetical protein CcaverHIS002_0203830 [Cutaneotrichosporon cavernicola]BEI89018.1 hypothetical protein CcaverHIS019_0203800 [Cutaneotrichosporon cavernicola]
MKRPLSLFERYVLACDETGHPMIITHVVSYSKLPSLDELQERVLEAQSRLPLLRSVISGAYTCKPTFAVREQPFKPTEIVYECDAVGDAMAVLVAELKIMRARKAGAQTPLWRIGVYPGLVAVTCNHVIADGMGSLGLVAAMTAPRDDPLSVYALHMEEGTHRTYDETVMLRAGLGMIVKALWRELVIPILPRFIQRWVTRSEPWPGLCEASPLGRDWSILGASVDADTLGRLSAVGKQKGVKTLHPLIETAYTAAVWAVFHTDKPFHFIANTPRSDRNTSKGHSSLTGLYTSLFIRNHEFRARDDLWDLARDSAAFLLSPSAGVVARKIVSMLRFIPNTEKNGTTGWMKYLTDRASCPSPFFEGIMVSNLGRFRLPPDAIDHIWGQACHPSSFAIGANVVGHTKGLRLTTVFWEGVPADSAQIAQVHRIWEKLICLMADGEEGTVEELTRRCM